MSLTWTESAIIALQFLWNAFPEKILPKVAHKSWSYWAEPLKAINMAISLWLTPSWPNSAITGKCSKILHRNCWLYIPFKANLQWWSLVQNCSQHFPFYCMEGELVQTFSCDILCLKVNILLCCWNFNLILVRLDGFSMVTPHGHQCNAKTLQFHTAFIRSIIQAGRLSFKSITVASGTGSCLWIRQVVSRY